MSHFESQEISVGTIESKERTNSLRVVKGLVLEVSDSIPHTRELGRTDYFEGVSYQLTLGQAKEMVEKLSTQIDIIENLAAQKNIVISEKE